MARGKTRMMLVTAGGESIFACASCGQSLQDVFVRVAAISTDMDTVPQARSPVTAVTGCDKMIIWS